jgi:peptidoglycan/LPS O-acetylase OafA/YrhL
MKKVYLWERRFIAISLVAIVVACILCMAFFNLNHEEITLLTAISSAATAGLITILNFHWRNNNSKDDRDDNQKS